MIRDRFGRVLAASRPSYNIYCVPLALDMDGVWPRLVSYMNLPAEERDALETRLKTSARRTPQGLANPRQRGHLPRSRRRSRNPHRRASWHRSRPVPVRYYPFEELGAQVLGFMSEVDPDALDALA